MERYVVFHQDIVIPECSVVFTTPQVYRLYQGKFVTRPVVVEVYQVCKTMEKVQIILDVLQEKKVNKNQKILVVGGGVLSDLVGFAASIYKRGVQCIYIPTTLMSMCDAAIGGKTGVNTSIKNNIGTIHTPSQIHICPNFTKTQQKRRISNGLSEVIKKSILYDKQLFQYLQQINLDQLIQNIGFIVKKSVQLKYNVVQNDPNDKLQRHWLNFGHTIGHALQPLTKHLHGQSISIGMALQSSLCYQNKLISYQDHTRLIKVLQKYGLPTNLGRIKLQKKFIQNLYEDKKNVNKDNKTINLYVYKTIGVRNPTPVSISIRQIQMKVFQNVIITGFVTNRNFIDMTPTSKSLTNRYLLLASLVQIKQAQLVKLGNPLISQDTVVMENALSQLGFFTRTISEGQKVIAGWSKRKSGKIYVGNSGITARFIIPLIIYNGGQWEISCQERMKYRPNQQLFKAIQHNKDLKITYLQKQFCLPVIINSKGFSLQHVKIDASISSQFVSGLLIISPLLQKGLTIQLNNPKNIQTSQSYIAMTIQCMRQFGIKVSKQRNRYIIKKGQYRYNNQIIDIECDLSTYSYLYSIQKIVGLGVRGCFGQKQGDRLFYQYVQKIEGEKDIDNYEYDFNTCTDTFMTMCALFPHLPTHLSTLKITNIQNQRNKQSNRIFNIAKSLNMLGAKIYIGQSSITIQSGIQEGCQGCIVIDGCKDHRIIMSVVVFLIGRYKSKGKIKQVIIKGFKDVNKTFPRFWNQMQNLGLQFSPISQQQTNKYQQITKQDSIILIGMRNSGKTIIGKQIAKVIGKQCLDLDQLIQQQHGSINNIVKQHGWMYFRQIQYKLFRRIAYSHLHNYIICTGGGIVENQNNRVLLHSFKNVILLDKQGKQGFNKRIQPPYPQQKQFLQVYKQRLPLYKQISKRIYSPLQPHYTEPLINAIGNYKQRNFGQQSFIFCEFIEVLVQMQSLKQDCQIIQVRLDRYAASNQQYFKKQMSISKAITLIKSKFNKRIILTMRSKEQGGYFDGDIKQLYPHLNKFIAIDYLDCELKYYQTINYTIYSSLLVSSHSYRVMDLYQALNKITVIPQFTKLVIHQSLGVGAWIQAYKRLKDKQNNMICILGGQSGIKTRSFSKWKMFADNPDIGKGILNKSKMYFSILKHFIR